MKNNIKCPICPDTDNPFDWIAYASALAAYGQQEAIAKWIDGVYYKTPLVEEE